MAENAQFLSETHGKHIKQCAKVSAFKRTLLESPTTSHSFFIDVFVSIWPFLGRFLLFHSKNTGNLPKIVLKISFKEFFKTTQTAEFC